MPPMCPRRLLDVACRDLRALYDVRRVEMFPHFPEGTLSQVEQEELMQLFVEQDSWSRASLAGSQWSWEGDKLTVRPPGQWQEGPGSLHSRGPAVPGGPVWPFGLH
ncbi:MAG: hypothetical protein ACLU9S_17190 [Oscillospiraceae bacterium]